jgi:uncharacterized protein YuzE
MRISYSEEVDVLYVTFSDHTGKIQYIEKVNGDILRVDSSTGMVVGVTIQLFKYRMQSGEKIEVPEIGLIPFNAVMSSLMEARLVKAH